MDLQAVRRVALSLPEATEEPHFELTSWRVRGKIFATAPPAGDELRVFVDETEVAELVAEQPEAFEPLLWGGRVRGVKVSIGRAEVAAVAEVLETAWRRRAPKRLVAELERARS